MKTYVAKTPHKRPCDACGYVIAVGDVVATWPYMGEEGPGQTSNIMRVHESCQRLLSKWGCDEFTLASAFTEDESKIATDAVRADRAHARPIVVCLCGSTRFIDYFHAAGWVETLRDRIVLSVGVVLRGDGPHQGEKLGVKEKLDELHKRKIDLADEILVLDVDGYIGDSTMGEIRYAQETHKPMRFLTGEKDTLALVYEQLGLAADGSPVDIPAA
jgi:hypothetical protein